jgi:hypothetical protein
MAKNIFIHLPVQIFNKFSHLAKGVSKKVHIRSDFFNGVSEIFFRLAKEPAKKFIFAVTFSKGSI